MSNEPRRAPGASGGNGANGGGGVGGGVAGSGGGNGGGKGGNGTAGKGGEGGGGDGGGGDGAGADSGDGAPFVCEGACSLMSRRRGSRLAERDNVFMLLTPFTWSRRWS